MTSNGGSVFTYEYDILGNLIEQTDALEQTEKFAYDVFGRLNKFIDKNGAVTAVEYVDNTSLPSRTVKTKSGSADEGTEMTYNAFGNVTMKKDIATNDQLQYTYTYDQKLLTITENGKTLTYTYDENAYLDTVTDYFNTETVYTYNSAGRVSAITRGSDTFNYTYNPRGYLQSETRGGITTEYAYTNTGLLQSLTNKTGSDTVISTYTYTYDLMGNRLSETETKGDTTSTESYTYDRVGRLLTVNNSAGLTEYEYDSNGNRSSQTVTEGEQSISTEYSYDLQNRLLEQTTQTPSEMIQKKYTYDNNGNLYSEVTSTVKQTGGESGYNLSVTGETSENPMLKLYRYNLSNQLVSYEDDNGSVVDYTYNADGMRSVVTVNGESTRYYYNGMYAVNEEKNNTLSASNIIGVSGIIGRQAEGSTGWFVKNGHGDVIEARTTTGTVLASYDYDPWGNSTYTEGQWDNPIRYSGEYYDEETGLIYLRNRYYDPSIGRFTAEDPIRDGLNWYVYCNNNPVMFVDPLGYWASNNADDKYKTVNPIVYDALSDLTETWNNLDFLEQQGIDIGTMKDAVHNLANEIRKIGNSIIVENHDIIGSRFNNVEKVLYEQYSSEGIAFLTYGVLARQKTEEYYGDGYRVNDDSDAFRHAYWNATLIDSIGSNLTELYTNAHEYGFPTNFNSNTFFGTKMDLYNNAQGREIGENVSKYNIYKEVLNAVRKGELKKIENGKLVPTNNGMVISAI